jgi:hypothetical protein
MNEERLGLVGPINSGAAVGGNGVATANQTGALVVKGHISAIYVRYNDAPPAGTTVVTVATAGNTAPAYNIDVITNAATDGLFVVRKLQKDIANADIAGSYGYIPVADNIKVTIAGANAGDSADVWLMVI